MLRDQRQRRAVLLQAENRPIPGRELGRRATEKASRAVAAANAATLVLEHDPISKPAA